MVISGMDQNNISLVIDTIQAKQLVELLRVVNGTQLKKAAKRVYEDGFDHGESEDVMCIVKSFINIVGNFTDKVVYKPPVKQIEGAGVVAKETQYVN